jgi:hypothetical protein
MRMRTRRILRLCEGLPPLQDASDGIGCDWQRPWIE